MRMELVPVSPVWVSGPNHSGAKLGGRRKSPSIDGGCGTLTCCPSKTVQRQGESVEVFLFLRGGGWWKASIPSTCCTVVLATGQHLLEPSSFLHRSREACGSGTRLLLLRFKLQEIKISLGVWLRG